MIHWQTRVETQDIERAIAVLVAAFRIFGTLDVGYDVDDDATPRLARALIGWARNADVACAAEALSLLQTVDATRVGVEFAHNVVRLHPDYNAVIEVAAAPGKPIYVVSSTH